MEYLIGIIGFLISFRVSNSVEESLCMAFAFMATFRFLSKFEKRIPVLEFSIFMFYLQLFIAPFAYYHYVDLDIYSIMYLMPLSESEYMGVMIPVCIAFDFGLRLFSTSPLRDIENKLNSKSFQVTNKSVGLLLLCASVISNALMRIGGVPGLNFVIALGNFMVYPAIFYIYYSNFKHRKSLAYLIIAVTVVNTLRGGIFIHLAVWMVFILHFLNTGKRIPNLVKASILIVGLAGLGYFQIIKFQYRARAWSGIGNASIWTYFELATQLENSPILKKIAANQAIVRLNQGWVVAEVINHTDKKGHVSGAQLQSEISGIFLPRLLFPNKIKAGTQEKFTRYTGLLLETAAMNLGVFGDFYANYGKKGSIPWFIFFCICCSIMFRYFFLKAKDHPYLLFWIPFIFSYFPRAGNEFYMIFNWVFKSFIFLMILVTVFPQIKNVVWQDRAL